MAEKKRIPGVPMEEDFRADSLPEMPETFQRVIGDIVEGEIRRRQAAMKQNELPKKERRSGTKTYGPKETVRKKGVY